MARNDRRHRIEHIETITAEDIPRFGKLGVIASFQPLHAYPDDDTLLVWARTPAQNEHNGPGPGAVSRTPEECLRSEAIGRSLR